MKYRLENDGNYLLCLDIGDGIISSLKKFASSVGLRGAIFEGIGALNHAEIGYFDFLSKTYIRKTIDEQREILSLQGNIGIGPGGETIIHAHIILGDSEMNCVGGHLFEGVVSVTAEIYVRPVLDIIRSPNSITGLNLWDIGEEGNG